MKTIMKLLMLNLLISSKAFAQQPDLAGDLQNVPYLILGLMASGLFAGVAIILFVRASGAGSNKASEHRQLTPPPSPSKPIPTKLPGLVPQELTKMGGFEPVDDFEEPTCFAELPKRD